MEQNETGFQRPFAWTRPREQAAALVAANILTDAEIAHEAGIGRATLSRWKLTPAFAARVESIVAEFRAAVLAEGIANKQNRIDRLNHRAQLLDRVLEARAADMADVPGGDTGVLLRKPVMLRVYRGGSSPGDAAGGIAQTDGPAETDGAPRAGERLSTTREAVVVHEYAVDTGLLAELRQLEKQAAVERGEWTERKDVTSGGERLERAYIGIDPDEV